MPAKTLIDRVYMQSILRIDNKTISHPVVEKAPKINALISDPVDEEKQKEDNNFEQISIFDDLND